MMNDFYVKLYGGLSYDRVKNLLLKHGKLIDNSNDLNEEEIENVLAYFGLYSESAMINFFGWDE